MQRPLLDIHKLTTCFASHQGIAKAVDTVSLSVMQGETLAVVGESGCGKTVLALSILGLVPDPPGRVTEGSILYKGQDLLDLTENELMGIRGNHISMIFQEPMTALNPVFKVDDQIAEPLRLHQGFTKAQALEKAVEALDRVGIPNPAKIAKSYPHELSGGMRQRVMIAMALACNPDLLIADEPTTALDVTIQAQILDLMNELKERMNGSLMLITHDLGRGGAHGAKRWRSCIPARSWNCRTPPPCTPNRCTRIRRGCSPRCPPWAKGRKSHPIPGIVPSIFDLPEGCRFHPRCPKAFQKCALMLPPLFEPEPGRKVRCWLYED